MSGIGLHAEQGHVHHIDSDYTNYGLGNLEIRHPRCHMQAHDFFTKTPEHCAAISRALKGKQNSLGRRHSEETRRKMSISARNRYRSLA